MHSKEQKEQFDDQNYIITFEDNVPSEVVFDHHTIKLLAPEEERPFIPATEIEEAQQEIIGLVEEGYMPVITIPAEYQEEVEKNGLTPRKTYIKESKNITGTIGIPPYKLKGRLLAIIKNKETAKKLHFRPRFTGKDYTFQGVISTLTNIPREAFILITPKELEYFRQEQEESPKVSGIRKNIKSRLKAV